MASTPLISVIVPVWNTARYLPECLDSLRAQTLADIEIICVDDASTDDSLDILRHYARLDARILVFALPGNQRMGGARNFGIEQARAPYVGFVDSDDVVSPDFYNNLYRTIVARAADIALTSYTVFDASTREVAFSGARGVIARLKHEGVHNVRGMKKAFGPHWSEDQDFSQLRVELSAFPTVVNKLYRRTLFDTARFQDGILFEDLLFTPQVLHLARRVFSCLGGEYYYRRHPASATRRQGFADLREKLLVAGMLDQWARQAGMEVAEKGRYEDLVRQKYHQAVKSLVKRVHLWTPARIQWVREHAPEEAYRYFRVRLLRKVIAAAALAALQVVSLWLVLR